DMYWESIRGCNKFIANIDRVPNDDLLAFDDKKRTLRKAEAKLLLAWNYSELLKGFGGLPIVTNAYEDSSPDNPELTEPRATYDQTVEFIVGLCEEAALALPDQWFGADYGRVTKGAALALISRVKLFAASPLWNNPNKPE